MSAARHQREQKAYVRNLTHEVLTAHGMTPRDNLWYVVRWRWDWDEEWESLLSDLCSLGWTYLTAGRPLRVAPVAKELYLQHPDTPVLRLHLLPTSDRDGARARLENVWYNAVPLVGKGEGLMGPTRVP